MIPCASFIVLLMLLPIASGNREFDLCPNNMSVLEKALYNTGKNRYQLYRIFFPPRELSYTYIKVNYVFLNNDSTLDSNCTVSYIWSLGFLLVQPPKVFQFTSLLFSYPANDLKNEVNLTLPFECRPLVMKNNDESVCSCLGRDNNELDILTQNVSI